MRFGLSIPNFAEPDRLLDVARAVDGNGWDGFFLWDHIVVDRQSPVPISEPWTVLAAAAMATSRCAPRHARHSGRPPPTVGAGATGDDRRPPVGWPGGARRRTRRTARRRVRSARRARRSGAARRPARRRTDGDRRACGRASVSRTTVSTTTSTACSSCPAPSSTRGCRSGQRRRCRPAPGSAGQPAGTASHRSTPPARTFGRSHQRSCRGSSPRSPRCAVTMRSRSSRGRWPPTPPSARPTRDAGATWLIDGPAPGAGWLDDAMDIATAGPPRDE